MIVCLCQGVSERRVRAAIAAGARTRRAVTRACGAGGVCGGCHDAIRQLIEQQRVEPRRGPLAARAVAGPDAEAGERATPATSA